MGTSSVGLRQFDAEETFITYIDTPFDRVYVLIMYDEATSILEGLKRGITPRLIGRIEDFVISSQALSFDENKTAKEKAYASLALAFDAYAAFPNQAMSIGDLEELVRKLGAS